MFGRSLEMTCNGVLQLFDHLHATFSFPFASLPPIIHGLVMLAV